MRLSSTQILKSEINNLANAPVTTYGLDYFKNLGTSGVDRIIRRVAKLIMDDEHDNDSLNNLLSSLHGFKHVKIDDKIAGILSHTWKYLNNLERKKIIQKLDKAINTSVKAKLLSDVEHFMNKMKSDAVTIEKGATRDYIEFTKGYSQLAETGPKIGDTFINKLYDIIPVDIRKSADTKLDKIIVIDSYAHMIHSSNCGSEAKRTLDAVAAKAKAAGEKNREDRLLLLYNPDSLEQLKKMSGMEILCKANILENRLRAKAQTHGLESLENEELVILWGFFTGEIN